MSRFLPGASFAAVLITLFGTGCELEPISMAGKACDTVNDCPPSLSCVRARPGQGRTCEALSGPPHGDTSGGGSGEPAYWCDGVDQVLTTYCAACHGESRAGSGNLPFRLDQYDDQAEILGAKSLAPKTLARMIEQRNMPPPGSPMPTEEELALVQAWLQSDAQLCAADGGL